MSKEMIQLDHIDVTFQQKKRQIQAVKDVTIHIQERDIYGIVGYSGAGKSTLVRVINLLQVPTSGKIIVDDDVLFDNKVTLTAEQLRRKRQDIGMIFQHFNLMSQLTAEENVAFALKHSGLSKEEKKEKRRKREKKKKRKREKKKRKRKKRERGEGRKEEEEEEEERKEERGEKRKEKKKRGRKRRSRKSPQWKVENV